jgi:hypothetical protein
MIGKRAATVDAPSLCKDMRAREKNVNSVNGRDEWREERV